MHGPQHGWSFCKVAFQRFPCEGSEGNEKRFVLANNAFGLPSGRCNTCTLRDRHPCIVQVGPEKTNFLSSHSQLRSVPRKNIHLELLGGREPEIDQNTQPNLPFRTFWQPWARNAPKC